MCSISQENGFPASGAKVLLREASGRFWPIAPECDLHLIPICVRTGAKTVDQNNEPRITEFGKQWSTE